MNKKIEKIEIENLGPVVNFTCELKGRNFWIVGSNNQGKSTVLESLCRILTDNMPSDIITEGEDRGMARVMLTDGTIIKWTQKRDKDAKVVIEAPDGIKSYPSAKFMREIFGQKFDINEYLTSPPGEKKKLIALFLQHNFTEIDSKIKEASENRTIANRNKSEAEKKLVFCDVKLLDKKPLDPVAITSKIEELKAEKEKHKILSEQLDKIPAMINSEIEHISELTANNIKLKQQIDEIKQAMDINDTKIEACNARILLSKRNNLLLKKELEELPPFDESKLEEEKKNLANVNELNASIIQAKAADDLRKTFEAVEKIALECEQKLKSLQLEKQKLMENSSIPIDGLVYTEDGDLTYYGVRLESLSKSRQAIIAAQLSMYKQKIPVIGFDAATLDKKSAEEFLHWCTERDIQVGLERPSWSDYEELRIEIIDNMQ